LNPTQAGALVAQPHRQHGEFCMTEPILIDLPEVARELRLSPASVEQTVALLDEGNTVPFITRYRKDQTRGLDEEQIRAIQSAVARLRQLAERKATILKTIEAQGRLTPELAELIRGCRSPKMLEDLYLPYKPRKQSLAVQARERGLEPLANEILFSAPEAINAAERALAFVNEEKGLPDVAAVMEGVRHILAETFAEDAELRGRLRRILQRTGKIVCTKVEAPAPTAPSEAADSTAGGSLEVSVEIASEAAAITSASETPAEDAGHPESVDLAVESDSAGEESEAEDEHEDSEEASSSEESSTLEEGTAAEAATPSEQPAEDLSTAESTTVATLPEGRLFTAPAAPVIAPDLKKKKKKKKKVIAAEHAFKDYYNYSEPLAKTPPHRLLAINRGERARAIRVKIEADSEAMAQEADRYLFSPEHPHIELLRGCLRDALTRLVVPSLEREARREHTEQAESHAVDVFIRNLRKLLLQPPTRGRRVLAIDPGFKSGCKIAALDEFGNVLGHSVIYVIGKDEKHEKARARLAELVRQFDISVIAIGNGTGCRETEQLVADVLAEELKEHDVAYVVANEAGASIYSTSPLGREELPSYDALQRGAISIGRRLLDPLSEMVKINPANLGVGLYQHDMKAKHLKDSLDAVVESCVNFVGVDVNSASPALLRYVSGMNALTARRVYEYRRQNGPFKSREELRKVPGFGEATFVQAAGFLKIIGGENPLDATWIHPESYAVAGKALEKLGVEVSEFAQVVPKPPPKAAKPEFGKLQEPALADASAAPAAASPETPAPIAEGDAIAGTTEPVAQVSDEAVAQAPEIQPGEPAVEPTSQPAAISSQVAAEQEVAAEPTAETSASAQLRDRIAEKVSQANVDALAAELGVGSLLLCDMLTSFTRPGLDPRDNLPPPIFRRGIVKLEDLVPGMELQGTVLNVVDFGAFIDIGLSDSGLVHISRLADRFIRDPHEVVGVGDVLKVWVVEVDKQRRRVSLTAIAPGAERPPRPPREPRGQGQGPGQGQRPPRKPRPQQGGQVASQEAGAGQPAGERSPQPRGGGQQGGQPQGRSSYGGGGGRPPRQGGGGRGRGHQREEGPPRPKVVERAPTKPKSNKPLSKAMEEGREPLRSFSDLQQLFDKKKKKPDESQPEQG
jgi:uncharacterized protein